MTPPESFANETAMSLAQPPYGSQARGSVMARARRLPAAWPNTSPSFACRSQSA